MSDIWNNGYRQCLLLAEAGSPSAIFGVHGRMTDTGIQSVYEGSLKSWGEHGRATLKLGIPLVGSQLGLMLMNTTDTVMLGWYGVEELAASVLATQGFFIIMIFGAGIGQAVMPMVAQAVGEGDTRMVRRVTRMGLWIALAYSLLVMPLFMNGESILLALGQEPRIAELAGQYLVIAMWAMFPTLLAHALRSFLSAIERAQIIFWSTLVAALANILINYMLIFGNWGAPELGVRGAAFATLLVNVLMFGAMALYVVLSKHTRDYEIFARFWRPDWEAVKDVLRLGIPIAITILAEVAMFIFSSIMMGWLGVVPLAAHGIALQLASIAFMVPLGLSQAATARVGNAYGRRDAANLWRAASTVMGLCLAFASASALLFFALPETLISLFLDETNPEALKVIAYAVPLLFIAAIFQLFDNVQAIAAGCLRGLKDTKVPMLMAIIAYWVIGLPLGWVLGIAADLGGIGVWAGLATGLAFAAVLLSARFVAMRPRP